MGFTVRKGSKDAFLKAHKEAQSQGHIAEILHTSQVHHQACRQALDEAVKMGSPPATRLRVDDAVINWRTFPVISLSKLYSFLCGGRGAVHKPADDCSLSALAFCLPKGNMLR